MDVPIRPPDLTRRRIERLFLGIALCYVALVARLVYLQAINGAYYRDKAEEIRLQVIGLPAERGAIQDRNGRPLAITTYRAALVCDPVLVKDPARTAAAASRVLNVPASRLLPALVKRTLPNGKADRSVDVLVGVSPAAAEAFERAKSSKEGADLVGLFIEDRAERTYPLGRDAVHVVGFTVPGEQGEAEGSLGLEQALDEDLRGHRGRIRAEVDAAGRVIPHTRAERVPARAGHTVRLTLDAAVQHIAQEELARGCAEHKPLGATAIVLQPATGDVLALANFPTFDPVKRLELRGGDEALRNRALARYEPGSTAKILTAAAALQEGIVTPSTTFYCSGHLPIGRRTIHCAMHGKAGGHGTLTLEGVIGRSCNVASAQIGMRLGMERLARRLREFGLFSPAGVGLPGDAGGLLGFGAEATRGGAAKAARVAFGQSVMVTPLGLAAAYGAIANDGLLMKTRLIDSVTDERGRVVRSTRPEPLRRVLEVETAQYLRKLLAGVVTDGTGKIARIPGYTVAGKTGTAQKVVKNRRGYASGKYVASFVGFVPAREPRAVILVVVDEPKGVYYGAQVAAPIFREIAERLLWQWRVPPDDPETLQRIRTARR